MSTTPTPSAVPASPAAALHAHHHKPRTVSELTHHNVNTVARIDAAMESRKSVVDHVVDAVSNFTGSLKFIWLHALWFGGWVLLNLYAPKASQFDPYPFGLLTLIVSLEAIFLSTIIMISQNRQARQAEMHNNLNLQISLLSEQENTKMLNMLDAIFKYLGIPEEDPDIHVLEQATSPKRLIHQIEEMMDKRK